MKRNKALKGILITVLVLALLAGGGFAGWKLLSARNAEPVPVFPFYNMGMTEYWGDSQESYGPVTTDRIQTVFLSGTQTVTEILVSPGQQVQKGDLLMTFDTSLTDLALERKRLEVEQLRLDLQKARERLEEINKMRPMSIPSYTPDDKPVPDENLGTVIPGPYVLSTQEKYDGSARELAIICWLRHDTAMDAALLEAMRAAAELYQEHNAAILPQETVSPEGGETLSANTGDDADPTAPPVEPTEEPVDPTAPPVEPTEVPADPTAPPVDEPVDLTVNHFFVICKVTESDMSLGAASVWQGMEITRNPATGLYSFKFFDASSTPDYTRPPAEDSPVIDTPSIDFGSGYTSSQIAEMRSQQEKRIKELEFQIKMTEADYKIMQTEAGDGSVYAEIDGEVVSVLTPEEAQDTAQPLIKVSGGGGFYIEGSISELQLDTLVIGQEVTINDWNTGMVYAGSIESIADYPASNANWSGMGNPNASYYPFRVFVDGSADLQEGSYVSVMVSAAQAENGIYLENTFLRTEKGQSYVYLAGEDGLLEKRFVKTGKSLWGSYTEILGGITEESLIAFPYGKTVREGAPTVESDISILYE